MVRRANGMLCEVLGKERMLTVGCGHFTAFNRSANHGRKCVMPSIRSADGTIDLLKLKKQPRFKRFLEIGWGWTICPAPVEVAWPKSPEVLQRAFNASHEAHSSSTEIEVAVTLAESLANGETEEVALQIATAAAPPCASYADKLLLIAKLYGGGVDKKTKVVVPLLYKADSFARKYGENRRLGEEFLGALASVKMAERPQVPFGRRRVDRHQPCVDAEESD